MVMECIGLKKEFQVGKNTQEILRGIDLQIQEQDFITIMGKSGSGKTTFLNCISLLTIPTGGGILAGGRNVISLKPSELERIRQEKIGMVFQNANLITCLSSVDNLVLAMHEKASYKEKKEKAVSFLKKIEMDSKANARVTTLSGGEKQRIAILRALVNHPEIVICDEPTGALDSNTSKGVMDFLIDMCKLYKSAIMIVTHDNQIGKLGTRQFIMERGILNEA